MEHDSNTTRAKLAKLIDDGSCAEAADLTASTILAEFVVIPRADLPEVVDEGDYFRVDGATYVVNYSTAAQRRQHALRYLAIAEYLEAKEAREAEQAAEARITARREELAEELYMETRGSDDVFDPKFDGYELQPRTVRASIDRIRELEDKLAEAQEAQA